MPQPPSSIQPVFLHIAQPAPSHCQQLMSISALGSVYGKKLGRNRTRDARREHLAREREQRALRDRRARCPSPTASAFDLAERRRVRQVEVVAAIDAARHDDADRRLVRLHVADLHRRGVRPQQRAHVVGAAGLASDRRREIQRVLHVARGMLGRHVQRVEAVPLVFDLRAFDDGEAHAREDRLPSDRERWSSGWRWPSARHAAGQRDVDGAGRPRERAGALDVVGPARFDAPASARWRAGRCRASRRRARRRSAASSDATTLFLRPR